MGSTHDELKLRQKNLLLVLVFKVEMLIVLSNLAAYMGPCELLRLVHRVYRPKMNVAHQYC